VHVGSRKGSIFGAATHSGIDVSPAKYRLGRRYIAIDPEDGCAHLRRTSPSENLELIYTLPAHFFSHASEGTDYRTGDVDPAQTDSL
jgi:hypothetical protein